MPTYDYRCEACGHEFEKFQSITARPVRVCPECRQRRVKRLIGTGAGILFKGSGFYQTDYRSASYKEAAKKESSPEGKKTEGGSKKSSGKQSGSDGKAVTKAD